MVVDASALIEWLLRTPTGDAIARQIFSRMEKLCAPELLPLEVVQALRRLRSMRAISAVRAQEALNDLEDLRVDFYPHMLLLRRIWELRDSLTAYDAAYVALAEELGAPLITCDKKLAAAHGHRAQIEVF